MKNEARARYTNRVTLDDRNIEHRTFIELYEIKMEYVYLSAGKCVIGFSNNLSLQLEMIMNH